jgi:hypothetical protein
LNNATYGLSGFSDDKYVEPATITNSRAKSLSKKAAKSAIGDNWSIQKVILGTIQHTGRAVSQMIISADKRLISHLDDN